MWSVCTALQGLSGLKVRVKLMSASHSLLAKSGEEDVLKKN
jgi:hypothetical protein